MLEDMRELRDGLRKFTQDCRPDMHEPDESGITAKVRGKILDNAFGEGDSNELVVVLKNFDTKKTFEINLASLIALARRTHL